MGVHLQRGLALVEFRRYREAVAEFTHELEEYPESESAFANRALAYINLGNNRAAEFDVRQAIAIDPEFAFAFYLLSIVHSNRRRPREAEKAIQEALRLEICAPYYHRLAEIHLVAQRLTQCLAAAKEALALDPHFQPSQILIAKALASLGRVAEAQALLRDALAIAPEDPEAHHALGAHVLQDGNVHDALTLLVEARRLDPLGYNDRDTIAAAYGQLLWPFRQIAPYLLRIERFTRRSRWLFWSVIGSILLVLKYLFPTTWDYPPIPVLIVFVALANLLALPISVDVLATALGKLVARRRLDVAWYLLLPEVIRPLFVLIFQALATGIGLGCAYSPPGLLIVLLSIAMNFDLFLVVARTNEWHRRIALLGWGSVILTASLSAAFVQQDQFQGIAAVWMVVIAISFFTTLWRP